MKISKDKILSFNYNYMMFIILIIQPILDIVSYFAVKYGYTSYTTIIRMIFFMGITPEAADKAIKKISSLERWEI